MHRYISLQHNLIFALHSVLQLLTVADVNECDAKTHDCHENATCSDVVGGFNCTCDTGFTGNGTFCEGELFLKLTLCGAERCF